MSQRHPHGIRAIVPRSEFLRRSREYSDTVNAAILETILTCPVCGDEHRATMPVDACQYFYDCPSCRTVLKPKTGDCCVFCSYGSARCPPVQTRRSSCSANDPIKSEV